MVAYIPAPALCQGADEGLVIKIGEIIFPDFVQRLPETNSLYLELNGDYKDDFLIKIAADRFQILLGVLRAWRPTAGQRVDEVLPEIGPGSIRDEHGNQFVKAGVATAYATCGNELESYAHEAKRAFEYSKFLRNALWLNGRRDRNAADYYMVYEYAKVDLGSDKTIRTALNVSLKDIARLTNSANNLAPTEGGRHAKVSGKAEWDLDDQKKFVARFLKAWIAYRANNPC